jgi:hypothetical protein
MISDQLPASLFELGKIRVIRGDKRVELLRGAMSKPI